MFFSSFTPTCTIPPGRGHESYQWIQEVAEFDVWLGADSLADLHAQFEVVK
jgi:hypothetical protein